MLLEHRYGLRIAAGRRGVAFHVGDGVHVTAAHCVDSQTTGDIVRSFGIDMHLIDVLPHDVALMAASRIPAVVFAVGTGDRDIVTAGMLLSFACWRASHTVGAIRVVSVSTDAIIAEPAGAARPLPGDSGAPVYLSTSGSVVGLVRGATGPGVLQKQIVVQRLDASSLHGFTNRGGREMSRRRPKR